VALAEGTKPPPHDFVLTDSKRQYKSGAAGVADFSSCAPPTQWSVANFEAVMALMLLAAFVVIRWRQRR